MYLGVDRYYDSLQAAAEYRYEVYWPSCDRCEDKLDTDHFEVEGQRLCLKCAYSLAIRYIQEEYPDDDPIEDHDAEVDELMDEWRRETEYDD